VNLQFRTVAVTNWAASTYINIKAVAILFEILTLRKYPSSSYHLHILSSILQPVKMLHYTQHHISTIHNAIFRLYTTTYFHYTQRRISTIHNAVFRLYTTPYFDYTQRHISTIHNAVFPLHTTPYFHYTQRHISTIHNAIFPLYTTPYFHYTQRRIFTAPFINNL
jgi:hypothetical protein